jgi:carboxymethylenebutenolidase
MSGKRIDLRTPDGTMDTYTFQSGGEGPWPAVIIYMDAFGIRPQLDEMAQRLASNGFFVVVPNLYYRSGAFAPFDPKQVFVEGPEQKRFRGMIQSIDPTMIMRDTGAVLDYLDNEPCVREGAMGAVGYCMGGGYAISALGVFAERVTVAASFHGASLATDKPDSPHLLAGRMRGRLYVGIAGIDPGFPVEQRDRLEQALSDASVDYTLEVYEGVKHGFAVTGHLVYDRVASERHWTTLLKLLNDTLWQQSIGV